MPGGAGVAGEASGEDVPRPVRSRGAMPPWDRFALVCLFAGLGVLPEQIALSRVLTGSMIRIRKSRAPEDDKRPENTENDPRQGVIIPASLFYRIICSERPYLSLIWRKNRESFRNFKILRNCLPYSDCHSDHGDV